MKLRRFWFTFNLCFGDPHPPGTLIGCGVTAFDQEDAIEILNQQVFVSSPCPAIKALIADVDVSTLDPGHVTPNMGDPTRRGVWFPLGYS